MADSDFVTDAQVAALAAAIAARVVGAPTVLVWSGTGFRRKGGGTDLTARPTTGPLWLMGGGVSDRPSWANEDGDSHDAEEV